MLVWFCFCFGCHCSCGLFLWIAFDGTRCPVLWDVMVALWHESSTEVRFSFLLSQNKPRFMYPFSLLHTYIIYGPSWTDFIARSVSTLALRKPKWDTTPPHLGFKVRHVVSIFHYKGLMYLYLSVNPACGRASTWDSTGSSGHPGICGAENNAAGSRCQYHQHISLPGGILC